MIPALLGVGGSLVYLLTESGTEGDIWTREFDTPHAAASGASAGLLRVDHISQTMHYEEMLSWLLYYSSLFEVSKSPAVQVADPLGLVQSQAIESPEGGLRLTLNRLGEQPDALRALPAGLPRCRRAAHRVGDDRHLHDCAALEGTRSRDPSDSAQLL